MKPNRDHTTLFPSRLMDVGGGERRKMNVISCSHCPEEASVPTGSARGGDGAEMLTRKFTRTGWYVGRTPGAHLCPSCNPTKQRAVLTVVPNHEPEKEEPVAQSTSPARELTFADRRIINAKLEEVYENELVGYRQGWNDEAVAADLGVDAAWVEQLRSQNFGPSAGNALAAELRAEQKELAARMEAFRVEGEKLALAIGDLGDRMAQAGLLHAA